MKYILPVVIFVAFAFFMISEGFSQKNKEFKPWEVKINAGYNIGGTSPLPLPQEVRKIKSYKPAFFAPHIGFEAAYRFTPKWGIAVQASFDVKSFEVEDQVQYLRTNMTIGEGSQTGLFSGVFTGNNTTKINNSYFSIPILVSYYPSEKWNIQAGVFVAYLYSGIFQGKASDGYMREGDPTGERIEITKAEFDFSENLRDVDWGIQVGGDWRFSGNWGLRGQVAWSLVPIFPSNFTNISFKMYNIYGTFGVTYLIR